MFCHAFAEGRGVVFVSKLEFGVPLHLILISPCSYPNKGPSWDLGDSR